ncbi:Phage tail fiber protein [Pseudomonas chlororaphis subsp. aureofaciens]|uniref:gp53-like domain-containing protein n=1 Tax=Pseudomonas chlororaphis TaxID=587753 RepID=UPI000F55A430|nr:hypothetical protein [Pseudomonas chlororaphis]AZE10165.1 Phage tail fiber protein [Pseudomonas chlororaphis subsp. aureofaciens]
MQKIGDSTTTADAAGEFTEGNPGAGVPATLLKSPWLNAIQRELLSVLSAAGLNADPANDSQLAGAMALLVKRAAGSKAGVKIITASTALTKAEAGFFVLANIAANGVITLPPFSEVTPGVSFYVQVGAASGAVKVAAPAGMVFGPPSGAGTASIMVQPGTPMEFMYLNDSTIVANNGSGVSLLEPSGYRKLFDGTILAWTRVVLSGVPARTFQNVTLPITFPNRTLIAFGSNSSSGQADAFGLNVIENDRSSVRASWSETNGGNVGARIWAIGN